MFQLAGILRYSHKPEDPQWWLMIDCDPEIVSYFRHLYFLARHRSDRLSHDSWATHVTIVRNEEPPDDRKHLWGAWPVSELDFEVIFDPLTDGSWYWLPVKCPKALRMRRELGLPEEPPVPLHLAIGYKGSEGDRHTGTNGAG